MPSYRELDKETSYNREQEREHAESFRQRMNEAQAYAFDAIVKAFHANEPGFFSSMDLAAPVKLSYTQLYYTTCAAKVRLLWHVRGVELLQFFSKVAELATRVLACLCPCHANL